MQLITYRESLSEKQQLDFWNDMERYKIFVEKDIRWVTTIILSVTFCILFKYPKIDLQYSYKLFIIPNILSILTFLFNMYSNHLEHCKNKISSQKEYKDEIQLINKIYNPKIEIYNILCYTMFLLNVISIICLTYLNILL